MSLECPRCQAAQTEQNRYCVQCGEVLILPNKAAAPKENAASKEETPFFRFAEPVSVPDIFAAEAGEPEASESEAVKLEAESAAPVAESAPDFPLPATDKRPAATQGAETAEGAGRSPFSWKLPALSALVSLGILLAALAGAAHILAGARQTKAKNAASLRPVVPVPVSSAPLPPAASRSLELSLHSADAGRHVPVGTPVQVTAYAALAPGRSATLSLACRAPDHRRTVFSFAEGRLCSATWTSAAPGRYEFTATVRDGLQQTATRSFWLIADAPVVKVSRSLSERRSPRRPGPVHNYSDPPYNRFPAEQLGTYHVVAAALPFRRNAETLAQALRAQGMTALTRLRRGKNGRATYAVETGTYRREADARQAATALQRRGYPAYTRRTR